MFHVERSVRQENSLADCSTWNTILSAALLRRHAEAGSAQKQLAIGRWSVHIRGFDPDVRTVECRPVPAETRARLSRSMQVGPDSSIYCTGASSTATAGGRFWWSELWASVALPGRSYSPTSKSRGLNLAIVKKESAENPELTAWPPPNPAMATHLGMTQLSPVTVGGPSL